MFRPFLRPRWLAFHALALALVGGFLALGWWQIQRAGQGNVLSFGYAVEWPVFAGFTVFVWVRVLRDHARPGQADRPARQETAALPVLPPRPAVPAPEPDADLAAYNRYLAALDAEDRRA
ncbi:MAG TPA: hypothetical protein VLJ59_18850 [Mycobacteriales bacterium]|nr:hypothetical protein [Mycobacteriales bacterium]